MNQELSTRRFSQEAGFTLIELLTVIGILGVLSALSIQSFTLYKPFAAFAVVQSGTDSAMKAIYAAYAQPGAAFPDVSDEQEVQGPITDATGRQLFPGFQLGRNMKITYDHDPACQDAVCPFQTRFELRHKEGNHYIRWLRMGDGLEVQLKVPGDGFGP
jgi:prepilin-type N-terminal cleavage/methylation domain-containing protein